MTTENPSQINSRNSKMKKREKVILGLLLILCLILISISYYGYQIISNLTNEIFDIKQTQEHHREHQIETNQLLLSNMDWSTRRQKQTLFMRDMIISEWKRIGEAERKKRELSLNLNEAYDIADNIMINSEIYPSVDPLLVLALVWKESAFYKKAESNMRALGLMQVLPITARPYFEIFGISFHANKLFDVGTNIKIGVRFLDDIYSTYDSFEKTLAYYNGGRWGATYYPDSLDKCPKETADYVPKVMAKWEEYKDLYKIYRVDSVMTRIE